MDIRTIGETNEWIHASLHKLFGKVSHFDVPPGLIVQDGDVWVFVQVQDADEALLVDGLTAGENKVVELSATVMIKQTLDNVETLLDDFAASADALTVGTLQPVPRDDDSALLDVGILHHVSAAVDRGGELAAAVSAIIVDTRRVRDWALNR